MSRQVAMVIDLNKCIGCQACTVACKSLWTDEEGQEYMLWNNVETKPGRGYPKEWEAKGAKSGWKDGQLQYGDLHEQHDYGSVEPLNHEEVYFKGTEERLQRKEPMTYGANWDEDTSSGDYPNNYHFYLPRLCNHCTKPACLEACPVRAIYKREQDGIVLVDQDKCQGFRLCNRACPYDKVYYNYVKRKSQKCIFCFPRLEQGVAPACARQCPGRLRFVGFLEDLDGPIHKLVHQWKVALPLHPEFGTEPNVYYVPPILPQTFDAEGRFGDEPRVPTEYLRYLFGPEVDQALITLDSEIERKKAGKASELMDLLIAKDWKSLFNIQDVQVYSSAETPTAAPK
ncbi:MAG: respiratory nitrate reductase subunit beta [Gammaproteobacteria bacterium]|nr:respiratory nitrate reductase subunit beta [Gammaproteobacteria bacterium]